ncbi:HupE/UreJ family protein [Paraflavitalea sp. CAU 1676]|uniref:HupE/UreJ family protein n=1 Tax=Paraflavitalea sp. CAU 1676 TaxID=3032598 RepID=UPI0023DA3A1C|nr:HupE/UreJ family protein [Paraflavitalea sp. CAU 1676]MDF2190118.1 HupE/UreJ family protein [Paraflavitalea sp. CAU 1676]
MQDFTFYFQLGIEHILTLDAMDHILFVTALCLRYLWQDWKKVVILVTAFTIGHSITLALSALGYVNFSTDWIEFLIPLTIAATCINNITQPATTTQKKLPLIYFFALFFGLIHGLAFAGQFLSLEGKESLVSHLLAFNLGIEVAQLLVVVVILFLSFVVVQLLKLSRIAWLRIASGVILVFSLIWAYQRFPHTKNTHDEKVTVRGNGSRRFV